MIPVEIGLPSLRVESFDPQTNSQKIREHLDLLEEAHDAARIRTAAYQYRVARYYNKNVKARQFDVGDLVLRGVEATGKLAANKTLPTGEGPFLSPLLHGKLSIQTPKLGRKVGPVNVKRNPPQALLLVRNPDTHSPICVHSFAYLF
ncbi:hypothetical protein Nepgr_016925 [Nepenthes gracilis]|uniref:Uncharacterized protein n=1 Tax=Nepenthes gracilis TaxID=150966 RepID=A0AAD3SQK4_NEPGR|nr:hypothetical protein Nepgr_016925 [Nepenthes gracilis]